MISTTKTTALVIGMFAIGGLIATNALTAAFADSNTSGDQVIKQTNKAKVYQKAKNTATQNDGISLASPITLSPNTAASSQSATVAQGNTNTGSNNGPVQTNTDNCGILAALNIIVC
jgi:hypothetical protein